MSGARLQSSIKIATIKWILIAEDAIPKAYFIIISDGIDLFTKNNENVLVYL